jgi:hypothetical protein
MWHEALKDRTFGFELEFADADKSKITLPKGYAWTDNELSRMHNSDGSAVSHTGQFGGEINTRPYKHSEEDLTECRDFIQSIKDAGGYLMWNEGFDAHFYVKDLPLDTIKKLFELSYWVAPYLKQIWDLAEWFENKYVSPSPEYSYVEKMNRVEKIEDIPNVFANASHRGHIRFYLNFVPVDRIGTMEFRLFNSSWKWEETYETIKFMYSYVDYVLKNPDVAKFREIDSIEKCIEIFDIDVTKVPRKHRPLLWASEHSDFLDLVGYSFNKPRPMIQKVLEAVKGFETVHVVNSHYADLEQVLKNENIVVHTKSLFIYLFYSIIFKDEVFELAPPFDWLRTQEGTKAERLAKLLLFESIKKCNSDDYYHAAKWEDYKKNFNKYVAKHAQTTAEIIKRLEGKHISVEVGDVLDAMEICGDDKHILVYQSEFNKSLRSIDNALSFYANILWDKIKTPYSKVNLDLVNYVVITKMKYMGLPKIFRSDRLYVYSNIEVPGVNRFTGRQLKPVFYPKIPDDHQITADSEIKFIRATMNEVDYLRMIYMKKDIFLGSSPFNYLWFVDGYMIGACMFDFSKKARAGGEYVWMKSDFVIDSAQDKLSKLLIMATLAKEFKEELDVRYSTDVKMITTTVFTNKPVSMKYRGVFKLDKRESGKLYYMKEAGSFDSLKSVMKEFIKRRQS